MYRILVDGSLFCDSRLDDLAIINPVVKNKINTAGSFEFSITKEHPNYDMIQKRISLVEVYVDDDSEPVFEGVCVTEDIDFYGQKKLFCEGALSFLNDSIQRQAHYQGYTSRQLLETYLNVHNSQVETYKQFIVGEVTAEDPNNSITCFTNFNSTMQEVKEDLIDDLGGYLRIRHNDGIRVLDYLAESPRTAEQTIELGKNLIDYSSNLDATQICTVLIPLGASTGQQAVPGLDEYVTIKSVNDDKDYIESDSVATYGRVVKTAKWDDVTTPSILKTKAEKFLRDEQFENVFLKITAIDFGLLTDRFDRFRVLDQVRVISSTHGMDRYFMLTEQTLNLNSPERDTIVLGQEERVSLSAQTAVLGFRSENAATSDQLTSAILNATNLLKGVDGGHIKIKTENGKPQEILIMDSDDEATATKIWRWNLNGFGYSNDGGQTYGTAITMDGSIVADYINGGTINGININGSVFTASGTVRRYASDYTQDDADKCLRIGLGTVEPTDADYEKLDINNDGIINLNDAVIIQRLIIGEYGDYIDISRTVTINGANSMGMLKTNEVAIGDASVRAKNFVVSGSIDMGPSARIRVKDSGQAFNGITGTFNNPTSIKLINGIVVSIN